MIYISLYFSSTYTYTLIIKFITVTTYLCVPIQFRFSPQRTKKYSGWRSVFNIKCSAINTCGVRERSDGVHT
ncbi:hypothetical protein BDV38DRAFT_234774 [Aspergillus pseudotamarii]|uniref:Uncharacterized protein n=1 Tax=Aspergillus pseudotamarii TaxID=132259 RepID=A0A5N6T7V9_ASPPS|nr:uncharacterized protein BDV38DRAFT_234774 [Aspergillus pseudotamarii]KAE8142423.1 hypothetical protein BDV38DRAFT_234774 [Aspergillus pseudotamarii]